MVLRQVYELTVSEKSAVTYNIVKPSGLYFIIILLATLISHNLLIYLPTYCGK